MAWRLFDVRKKTISKNRFERFVSLNGLGWPAHAKETHDKHAEYAQKTLLAYMPCPGYSGTEYVHQMVAHYFHGDWPRALRAFVLDPTNRWCPKWVRRNYEMLNDVPCGFPDEDLRAPEASAPPPHRNTNASRTRAPSRPNSFSAAASLTQTKPTRNTMTQAQHPVTKSVGSGNAQRGRSTASKDRT